MISSLERVGYRGISPGLLGLLLLFTAIESEEVLSEESRHRDDFRGVDIDEEDEVSSSEVSNV